MYMEKYMRIFYCNMHDDFIIKPYNKSFSLEESNIYDYNDNDLNCANNLPCNYELLTIAKKENSIWKLLEIRSNEEKWIIEENNNTNLEFYLLEMCNGGISQKTLFNELNNF